jgi:hypothetical protein
MLVRSKYLVLMLVAMTIAVSCGGSGSAPSSASPQSTSPAPPPTEPAGEAKLPPGHPPVSAGATSSAIQPPPPGSGTGSAGMSWAVPEGWLQETPSSSMRKAQYRVPGPGGDGECAVFYFGPGQGGDPLSNAQRWAAQFKKPDGSLAADALKTSELQIGEMKVLRVEVRGTYAAGMTMGSPTEEKPGYMLLGAIAEGPDSNWFFKLTGPEKTVEAQREAFETMLNSLKKGV